MDHEMFESCLPSLSGSYAGEYEQSFILQQTNNSSFPLFNISITRTDEHYDSSNLSMDVDFPIFAPTTKSPPDVITNGFDVFGMDHYQTGHNIIKIFHPIICIFGLLGNILTLLILTRKRLKMSCDGTERTVNIGLTALAVSDFLFCLTLLPYGFMKNNQFSYWTKSFNLVYQVYSGAIVNTFILTSTWLTVTMATSRYLAICHPFRARHLIDMTGTKISIMLVYLICVAFNIPRYFVSEIESLECENGQKMYFKISGYFGTSLIAHTIYMWIYFIIGISLPLAMLAFCNICLIRALRESVKIRRHYRVHVAHVDSNHRITSILVTIVIMYIVLVSPAEILLFIQDRLFSKEDAAPALILAKEITNLLQMINFSCNFLLYFILNVNFRRAMKDMCCSPTRICPRRKENPRVKAPLNRQISSRTTQTII